MPRMNWRSPRALAAGRLVVVGASSARRLGNRREAMASKLHMPGMILM
jgi:hypothetical protein